VLTHGRSYLTVDSPMFFHCLKKYITLFLYKSQYKALKVLNMEKQMKIAAFH
jgi:reverse gyrase